MLREKILNFKSDMVLIRALEYGIACTYEKQDNRFVFTCNDFNKVVEFLKVEYGEMKIIHDPFDGTEKEVLYVPFNYVIVG